MKLISDPNQTSLVDRSLDAVWHPCTQMKHHESLPLIAITKGDGEDVGCKPEVASKNRDKGIKRGIENGRLKIGSDEGEDNDRGGGEQIDGGVVTGGENDSE